MRRSRMSLWMSLMRTWRLESLVCDGRLRLMDGCEGLQAVAYFQSGMGSEGMHHLAFGRESSSTLR